MAKDYNIIAFDAQYILHRNFAALKSRTGFDSAVTLNEGEGDSSIAHIITKYNFDYQTLVKHFYWSIVKMVRDHFSCNKVILLWDVPPYHKLKWVPDFKGDRVHYNKEYLDEFDIENDPQGYLQAREEVAFESVKNEAKWFIINTLYCVGMPSVNISGFEADDLAYLFSQIIQDDNHSQKSAICSVDSDWMYWTSLKVDWIKHTNQLVWTYSDGLSDCEGKCEQYGWSLFELKKFMDSTFLSHNGVPKTTTLGWKDIDTLVADHLNGTYEVIDKDQFESNMSSFELQSYPNYSEAISRLKELINSDVVFDYDKYRLLRTKGFSVSQSYIENYQSCLIETVEEGSEP